MYKLICAIINFGVQINNLTENIIIINMDLMHKSDIRAISSATTCPRMYL